MRFVGTMFRYLWRFINGIRRVLLNIIFFALVIGFLALILQEEEPIVVPENGVLVINPQGILVEEKTYIDPVDQFINQAAGSSEPVPEVLLSDVVEALEKAASDDRIGAVLLDLSGLYPSGINKLQRVADALQQLKTTEKPVIANGDAYAQHQYYLAAHAKNLYLNPLGGVAFDGFEYGQIYFKGMLDKLKLNPHVFKVGEYKSAVEPFVRNSMSEQARQANDFLFNDLWQEFKQDVVNQRQLTDAVTSGLMEPYLAAFNNANGNLAKLALEANLVDALKTRAEVRNELINLAGYDEDKKTYRHISFADYLNEVGNGNKALLPDDSNNEIAVVVARGQIVDGYQRAGMVGGDSTAELIRKARQNEKTKAIILRIDSPGGSGFASEIIRQEVLEAKKQGLPVIASMSSVAASGGYWIAAEADQIWAASTTITGSIGVFGLLITAEDTMQAIGVNSDSYSTTEMPSINILEGITDAQRTILQRSTENFYDYFLEIVADARDMTKAQVDEVAQGRIWTGEQAQQRGLIDSLGNLDNAVEAAAKLAEVDEYRVVRVEQSLDARQQFLADMLNSSSVKSIIGTGNDAGPSHWLMDSVTQVLRDTRSLQNFNDPKNIYSYCALCPQPR
ncbi:signal peptide peptidase SppA [Idiomarina seosinensis]|uniref:signal peptide peptidase SppA n=1 Tax=Idiomarina seosinensis TaxID=281739 RepID=UPI00384CCB1C